MTTAENVVQKLATELAADEAYRALNQYEINRRRVVFIANGQKRVGSNAIVREAHLHTSSYLPTWIASRQYGQPQVVAVKEIKLSAMHDASDLKRALTKEVLVWSRLGGHPRVAKFLGFWADFERSEAWLISPWEPCGNVSEFVRGRELEVPERLSLAYDTIDALAFLHQLDPPMCHGDIKSANVLVNLECRAVLCDFGLARLYEDSEFAKLETSTEFNGSIRWCSPELLDGHPRTASSDIYAWAWLVWEIMTGELPYEGAGADYDIMREIFESPLPQVNGESRLSECLQLWDLVTRCWAVQPLERPTSVMCKTTVESLPHCPPTPQSADPQTRSAALLENLGDLESWKGDHKAGFAYLEEALHRYEEEGNDKGIASVLLKQAAVASRDSNHVKIMSAASAALDKCRTLQDEVGVADALCWIGCAFLMEHKRADAMRNLQESLRILRVQGNSLDLAKCLRRLGEVHRREGRTAKALTTLEEAVGISRDCGDRLGEANGLLVLGGIFWDLGDVEQAIATFSRGRDIARNIGWEPGLSTCLCRLGYIKMQQGMLDDAEELLEDAARVARNNDAGWRLGQALYHSGECFSAQARHEDAVSAFEDSYWVYDKLGRAFEPKMASAAGLIADLYLNLGDEEEALAWYDKAIAEWRKGGKDVKVSQCLTAKGGILLDMNRWDEAALHYEAALVVYQELWDSYGMWRSRERLSFIPKTVIKWEVGRQARLARAKSQLLQNPSLMCDVKKLQRRAPQLMTPNLKAPVEPINGSGL